MWLNLMICLALTGHSVEERRDGLIGIRYNSLSNVISAVYKDSPADKAGLKPHDKVLHAYEFSKLPIAGSVVELTIKRKGHVFTRLIERAPSREVDKSKEVEDENESSSPN